MDSLLRFGGGTLCVALAKRDYIVLATESRRTDYTTQQFQDNCRKLFSVGPYRVLAIAGVVDASLSRIPGLTAQLVPLLEQELKLHDQWHDAEWQDRPPAPPDLPAKLRLRWHDRSYSWWVSVMAALQTIYNIAYTFSDVDFSHSRFQALIAGFTATNLPNIDHLTLTPQKSVSNWNRPYVSFYQTQNQVRSDGGFIWRVIGATELAESVLSGAMTDRLRSSVEKYRGISSYTQRQAKSALDTMPDDEIVELAHDLIYATAEWTPCVGATPIQTATIKPGEQATIDQPPFPRSGMFLPSDGTWHHGVKFTSDYPFDERRTGVVYTSCLINENRRPIPLGDNYFYGNEFIGAIFQYSGGGIFFGENNRAQHCTLLVTNGVDSSKLETITWAFTEVKIIP